jgi:hypothetical protein
MHCGGLGKLTGRSLEGARRNSDTAARVFENDSSKMRNVVPSPYGVPHWREL